MKSLPKPLSIRTMKMGKEKNLLTDSEIEVVKWLSYGKRQSEIAEIMSVKTNAIHQRIYIIMNKLGTNTSAGIVGIALRKKLVE